MSVSSEINVIVPLLLRNTDRGYPKFIRESQDPGHYGFQVIIRKKSKSDEKAAVGQNKQNSKKYTTLIKITQRRVTDALVLLASLELAVLSVSLV